MTLNSENGHSQIHSELKYRSNIKANVNIPKVRSSIIHRSIEYRVSYLKKVLSEPKYQSNQMIFKLTVLAKK